MTMLFAKGIDSKAPFLILFEDAQNLSGCNSFHRRAVKRQTSCYMTYNKIYDTVDATPF